MSDTRDSGDSGGDPVPTRGSFPLQWPLATRWTDNDMFGHLNNAVYYALFDTAINAWLAAEVAADPMTDDVLPLVAESRCRYLAELAFPTTLVVGIGVERLGRSSVAYRLGLYPDMLPVAGPVAAVGRWVHVYVDRSTRRPVPLPTAVRTLHERLLR